MYQGTGVWKCSTFVLNSIVFIGGIAITLLGAQGLCFDPFKEDSDLRTILISMIVLGSLIIVFSLVGTCALLTENTNLINFYSFLCFVSAILILVTGIVAFVFKNKIVDKQFNAMEKRFKRVEETMSSNKFALKDADEIEIVQNFLKCCGWTKPFLESSPNYPSSCTCAGNEDHCHQFVYSKTCSKPFKKHVSNSVLAVGILCSIILIFPIICAASTSKMVNRIKSSNFIRDLS